MIELLQMLQGILERGLIFSFMAASMYIATRVIHFDNLSVEGAFGLGGAVTAYLLVAGYNPWVAFVCAGLIGVVSGIVTGLLHTKLKINALISGIVVTTGLFSIALKIASSNMTLGNKSTILSCLSSWSIVYTPFVILALIVASVFVSIHWFLKTEVGYLLQAVGDTPQMLTNIGKNVDVYVMMGLAISNMLAAISGSLFVQYSGYFSIWASVGILIIGLAGMILAQTISSQFGLALVAGSIIYQAIIALTFELQFDQNWNKLITAVLIVVLIVINQSLAKK